MIDEIHAKIATDQFELSRHALDQTLLRRITIAELKQVIASGIVIEDYPADKYGPSCLIFGLTTETRPLHIQCSYPSRKLIKIVTLYEPDPSRWIEWKVRRT